MIQLKVALNTLNQIKSQSEYEDRQYACGNVCGDTSGNNSQTLNIAKYSIKHTK